MRLARFLPPFALAAAMLAASGPTPAAGSTGGAADAFLAAREGLVGLGFSSDEAEAALSDAPDGAEAEVLIRHALGRLRR